MAHENQRKAGKPADPPHLPSHVVDFGAGESGLRTMRDLTADVCDLDSRPPPDAFRGRSSALLLGPGMLIESETTGLIYDRTTRHIARSGVDHYLVSLYLEGHARVEVGSRAVTIRPGDIAVADMSVASRTFVHPSSGRDDVPLQSVAFIVPRRLLAPLLAAPDTMLAVAIRGDEPYGLIVRDYLLSIRRNASRLTLAESESVVRTMTQLLAGGLRPEPGAELEIARADATARYAAITRYIKANLGSPAVEVDALCRTFATSRAALYRLFEDDGGIVRFVRRQQLRRACAALLSDARLHLRIVDIATEAGFQNESSFIRAFRREFGTTPGELRDATRASGTAWLAGDDSLDWMRRLDAL
jgi:AraC-like DNA-binding protein